MDKLIFEKASQADIPVIFGESKALVDAYEDLSKIDYNKVISWIERKITNNIHRYTVICMNGEKVGYFRLEEQGNEAELDDLYILPPYRNRGIGKEVLRRCLNMTDKPVFLYVFKQNEGAIRLYKSMGFSPVTAVSETRLIMRRGG